jgi:hypothetical protein
MTWQSLELEIKVKMNLWQMMKGSRQKKFGLCPPRIS